MERNLYDMPAYFRLIRNGIRHSINEPVGWDKIKIKLSRDDKYYGFNYEFTEDKVNLEFPSGDGKEIIQAAYDEDGSDAQMGFEYGYIDEYGTERYQFKGTVNFNEYDYQGIEDETIQMPIEKQAFDNKLRTRSETLVSLNATQNLDDGPMTPATSYLLRLHSKELVKTSSFETPQNEPDSFEVHWDSPIPTRPYLQLNTLNATSTEAEETISIPAGWTKAAPWTEQAYVFKAKEAGPMTIKWSLKADLHFRFSPNDCPDVRITPYYAVYRPDPLGGPATQVTMVEYSSEAITDTFPPTEYRDWSVDIPTTAAYTSLEIGDELYVGYFADIPSNSTPTNWGIWDANFTNFFSKLSLQQATVAKVSTCLYYDLFTALNKTLEACTGVANAVKSAFLGPGGCGSKVAITNGFQIRGFEVTKRPVQASYQVLFEGAAALYNLGAGYQTQPDGTEAVVIEPMDYFFSGGYIMTLMAYDYTERHGKEMVFNELDIGFEKFSDEKLNTLDDFSTYHTYTTPITTFKSKKSVKSKLIASGYSIEVQRREQFKETPSSSVGDDDSLFCICYLNGPRIWLNMTWSQYTGTDYGEIGLIGKAANLVAGDVFYLDGLGGPGTTAYTVTGYGEPKGAEIMRLIVSPAPPALTLDAGSFRQVFSDYNSIAETNEQFQITTGLISPQTTYNLRISPKRMLYNWATYFNIGFHLKSDTEKLKCTFVKQNKDMVTKFSDAATCTLGVTQELGEAEDVSLLNYRYDQRPFMPRRAIFKVRLSYPQLIILKKALRGELPDGDTRNYGWVVHNDTNGKLWKSHVISIDYQPAEEIAEFNVYKIGLYQ